MKFCSTCDEIYNTTDAYCMHCGHKLKDDTPEKPHAAFCPSCNLSSHPGDTFCMHCGGSLSEQASVQPAARPKHDHPDPSHPYSRPAAGAPIQKPTKAESTLTKAILERENDIDQLNQQLAAALHRLEKVEAGEAALKDAVKAAADAKEKAIRTLKEQQSSIQLKGNHNKEALEGLNSKLGETEQRLAVLEKQEKTLREEEDRFRSIQASVQELDKLLAAVALKSQAGLHEISSQLAAEKEEGAKTREELQEKTTSLDATLADVALKSQSHIHKLAAQATAEQERRERDAQSLGALQEKVAALDAALASMEQAVSSFSTTVAAAQHGQSDARLPEKVTSLESIVEQVEKSLAAAVLRESSQVSQLKEQVAAILTTIEPLKQVVSRGEMEKELSLITHQLEKLEEQGGQVSTAIDVMMKETMNPLQSQLNEQSSRLLRVESQRLSPQDASPADLERELEIGLLRKELAVRLGAVEAALEAQKETAQLFSSFESGASQVGEQVKSIIEQQEIATLEQRLGSTIAGISQTVEEELASQSIEMKKLRDNVSSLASGLQADIADLQAVVETSAASTVEKQTAENMRTITRIQKGIGKLYAEVGSLVADRSKWVTVMEQEIREKVKAALGDQKESVQRVYDDISSEFSKLNILVNHHEKRMDFFMNKTEEELKELREKPVDFSRFTSTVITELDEIKFRMQQLEHKAVHADTEEIVDAITELEHRMDSLRALQPIIIE